MMAERLVMHASQIQGKSSVGKDRSVIIIVLIYHYDVLTSLMKKKVIGTMHLSYKLS